MPEEPVPEQVSATKAAEYRRWAAQIRTLRALVVDQRHSRQEVTRQLAALRRRSATRSGAPRQGRRRHSGAYYQSALDLVTSWPVDRWQELERALSRARVRTSRHRRE